MISMPPTGNKGRANFPIVQDGPFGTCLGRYPENEPCWHMDPSSSSERGQRGQDAQHLGSPASLFAVPGCGRRTWPGYPLPRWVRE